MCGRMVCTLCKNDLLHATRQYSPNNEMPEWVQDHKWQVYKPSFNIAPNHITPVLLRDNFVRHGNNDRNIIYPMKWGLMPSWYKSGCKDFIVSSHNCRSETVFKKITFKSAVSANKRCVILADGFYEWMAIGADVKAPYFIHFPNDDGSSMKDRDWVNTNKYCNDKGEWTGPRLLTMAGIFDVCRYTSAGEMYSYSILTTDSSSVVQPIHPRMPLILDGPEKVRMWLDYENIGFRKAINHIKATENLELYSVDTVVNDTRNDSIECVKSYAPNFALGRSLLRKNTAIVPPNQPKITSFLDEPSSSGLAPKKPRLDSGRI